ncbi:ATP-binding cassette domain-containing protein [Lentisphaera profundi]|uniref:ATP-binding cassette domain-containing protein n=1 Tax=Lentisphaera profundi TaxID=1658616 RepID=A0ABY7VUX5_9BACT|nr:oligopeptide/dipeptide ABC transporter ATP-binding protein [Lentisphaera profundi]WDE96626.1 ATP-binding cassette domain-containing protein [Lentisphaera profundi]
MIEIKDVSKHFDLGKNHHIKALDKVSLQIHEKEILGLVGESGSGKSTLGKVLAGLHSKTSGTITYNNSTLPDSYSAKDFLRLSKEMQMIFQDPYSSLNPRMTVGEIIGEGLSLRKESKKVIQEKVQKWLLKVGLHPDHASRFPHEFSGGQRQRIGIARALIVEPKFVICDEPISALDVSVQAQVIQLLQDLKNDFGLTLLFIAHDLSMVRHISDRIAVLYLGQIMEIGPADEVFFHAKHPYTQKLNASNPIPDPKRERQNPQIKMDNSEIPSPSEVLSGCPFASRCPHVTQICRDERPQLIKHNNDHQVACHHLNDV